MKQLEIIQTKNYLVAVSDEEFGEGDNVLDNVKRIWLKMESCFVKVAKNSTYGKSYKIIAHLPLNNSPVLEGVILLPEIQSEEVSNATTKIYSKEDMINFATALSNSRVFARESDEEIISVSDFFDKWKGTSNYPKYFLAETEYFKSSKVYDQPDTLLDDPIYKTVTDSQKQERLVGTYKFK